MFRRSLATHFLRTTTPKRAGVIHPIMDPAKFVSADTAVGILYQPYNGPLKLFRLIDFRWWLNRAELINKDSMFGLPIFLWCWWTFLWNAPQKALWGDGVPPRTVDWNKGTAGNLPEGYQGTL